METPTPLVEELKAGSEAVSLLDRLYRRPGAFWLDSGMGRDRLGKHSFLGSDPFLTFRSKGASIEIVEDGEIRRCRGNP